MSLSHSSSTAARPPRAAVRLAGPGRAASAPPLRVREWSGREPAVVHLLDGAAELRFVSADALPTVARALALTGHVVVVGYDDQAQKVAFYCQRERLTVGPHATSASDVAAGEGGAEARDAGVYEDESSERVAVGSIPVGAAAWWSATLTVPTIQPGTVFLRLARHGAVPPDYRGDTTAELSVPESEVDAAVALLEGVVAHARRDGVLAAGEGAGAP